MTGSSDTSGSTSDTSGSSSSCHTMVAPAGCLVALKCRGPRGFSSENSGVSNKSKFLLALPAVVKKLLSIILLVLQLESTLSFLPSQQAISSQPVPLEPGGISPKKSPENLTHHFHKGESWDCSRCRRRMRNLSTSVRIQSDG